MGKRAGRGQSCNKRGGGRASRDDVHGVGGSKKIKVKEPEESSSSGSEGGSSSGTDSSAARRLICI